MCYALVDNIVAHLCQTIHVRLTGTIVAALDGVVVQTINTIAVVLVVLCSVDTALCGNGVRTARTVLNTEVQHVEAHLCEGCSSGSTGETRTYHNHVQTAFVSGVHQFLVVLVIRPFKL